MYTAVQCCYMVHDPAVFAMVKSATTAKWLRGALTFMFNRLNAALPVVGSSNWFIHSMYFLG